MPKIMDGETRSLLADLLRWLEFKLAHGPIETRGRSDQSGHPHSYAVVLIPDWDVKQKVALIRDLLDSHSEEAGVI